MSSSTATTSETTSEKTTSSTTETTEKQTSETTQSGKTVWGDANEDKQVEVSDAVLVARFAAEDSEANISAQGKLNADVTGDQNINGDDTIKILRAIAKLITLEELAKYMSTVPYVW